MTADLPYRLIRSVVFVGMMGCGKSAIGRAVAQMLSAPYDDTDAAIEESQGMVIAEIFASQGEKRFRILETEVLDELLSGPPRIMSAGGGLFMSRENRALISGQGVSIWIDAELDILWERVQRKSTRPLLNTPDPYGTLESLLAQRKAVYSLADLVVQAEKDITIHDMAHKTIGVLASSRNPVFEDCGAHDD